MKACRARGYGLQLPGTVVLKATKSRYFDRQLP
jgi:hypothetical protein